MAEKVEVLVIYCTSLNAVSAACKSSSFVAETLTNTSYFPIMPFTSTMFGSFLILDIASLSWPGTQVAKTYAIMNTLGSNQIKVSGSKFNSITIKCHLGIMPVKPEDEESELMKQMFDEIMKMIHQKHIKLETIVHRMIEQGSMSQESFDRIYQLLTEYGKKRQWIRE